MTFAAGAAYWLKLDDLRLPRPKPDEAEDVKPKAKAPIPSEPAHDVPPEKPAPSQATDSQAPLPAKKNSLQFGGSYRALVIGSHTPDEANRRYSAIINRLRLKLSYQFSPDLIAKVEHDTQLTAGNYVNTDFFQSQRNASPLQYWGGPGTWADNDRVHGTQGFFRAYVKYFSDAADITLGRQRIPLGTGRFWSTLDMLNPINPLQVERDEFIGVDALLLERSMGNLSKAALIYAPDPAGVSDRWIAQYRTNFQEADITLTLGKYWRDTVIGADFATQLGAAGIHGELAYTRPDVGSPYRKLLLGVDYALANTLSFSSELYYSDQGRADYFAQGQRNPLLAMAQPPGSAYLGLAMGYDFTPLLKMSTYLLVNLDDSSRVLYPALTYSISDNGTLMGGAQLFSGSRNSEYGRGRNLYFARFQYHF